MYSYMYSSIHISLYLSAFIYIYISIYIYIHDCTYRTAGKKYSAKVALSAGGRPQGPGSGAGPSQRSAPLKQAQATAGTKLPRELSASA